MAPSATQTTTQEAPAVLKLHSTQSGTGDYKQLQQHGLSLDDEVSKGFEPPKVRRSSPAEKKMPATHVV